MVGASLWASLPSYSLRMKFLKYVLIVKYSRFSFVGALLRFGPPDGFAFFAGAFFAGAFAAAAVGGVFAATAGVETFGPLDCLQFSADFNCRSRANRALRSLCLLRCFLLRLRFASAFLANGN